MGIMRGTGDSRKRRRGDRGRSLLPLALLFGVLLAPPAARAETFINTDNNYPINGAGTFGPGYRFPSTIALSGLSGTVAKVRVTLFGFRSSYPDDADVMISGPNGQTVTLVSDACGATPIESNNWTFDDSAEPLDISNTGPCGNYEELTYSPTRWLPEDDLSPSGGPPPPYSGQLASLTGGSPNGAWNLWMLDDNESVCCLGFEISGWALTLDITPQPPPAAAGPTGQRAAALAKCRKKKGKKRKKCKKKASQLPV